MPQVTIDNLQSKTIDCTSKTEKLLDILLRETDWMHACGAKGKCTTCTAIIKTKNAPLSQRTQVEKRFEKLGKLSSGERLSCQVIVQGDIHVEVPEAYKLPHLDYSY